MSFKSHSNARKIFDGFKNELRHLCPLNRIQILSGHFCLLTFSTPLPKNAHLQTPGGDGGWQGIIGIMRFGALSSPLQAFQTHRFTHTRQERIFEKIRQELSPATCKPAVGKRQVRDKGVPSSYHHGKAVSSLVDDCQTMHPPPALLK